MYSVARRYKTQRKTAIASTIPRFLVQISGTTVPKPFSLPPEMFWVILEGHGKIYTPFDEE